jgi:hypothetical protein
MIPDAAIWDGSGMGPDTTMKIGALTNNAIIHNVLEKRPGYTAATTGISSIAAQSDVDLFNPPSFNPSNPDPTTPASSLFWNSYFYSNVIQCLPNGAALLGPANFPTLGLGCPTKGAATDQGKCVATAGGGDTSYRHFLGNVLFDIQGQPTGNCKTATTTPPTGTFDWTYGGSTNNIAIASTPSQQAGYYANTGLYIRGRRPGDWTLTSPAGAAGLCTSASGPMACYDTSAPGINNAELMTALGQASVTAIPTVITGQWTRTALHAIYGNITGVFQNAVAIVLTPGGQTLYSDVNGNYVFLNLPDGTYTLTVNDPGCNATPPSVSVTLAGADQTAPAMAVDCPSNKYTITGSLTGVLTNGVTLTLTSGATTVATIYALSANYSFGNLGNGTYTVTPSAAAIPQAGIVFNPASSTVIINNANQTGINFASSNISGTWLISGSMVQTAGIIGRGSPGLTQITNNGRGIFVVLQQNGSTLGSYTSDANSIYQFVGLPAGTYTMVAAKNGLPVVPASCFPTCPSSTFTFTLTTGNLYNQHFAYPQAASVPPGTSAISGTITGPGKTGATVAISGTRGADVAATDSSGNYVSLANLPDGTYTVVPVLSGYIYTPASSSITISGGSATGVNFSSIAYTNFNVSGTVSGDVKSGVTITAGTTSAVSDVNGNYILSLPPGNYTLTPALAGYTFNPVNLTMAVVNANVTGQNFVATALPATYLCRMQSTGAVAVGVLMSATGTTTASCVTAGAQGTCDLYLPNGSYTFTPGLTGYTFTPASQSKTVNNAGCTGWTTFTAAAGPPSNLIISGTITGDVTDGVTVNLSGAASGTVVSKAGSYSFTGLGNGSYTVTPIMLGYIFQPVSQAVTLSGSPVTADFVSSINPGVNLQHWGGGPGVRKQAPR